MPLGVSRGECRVRPAAGPMIPLFRWGKGGHGVRIRRAQLAQLGQGSDACCSNMTYCRCRIYQVDQPTAHLLAVSCFCTA